MSTGVINCGLVNILVKLYSGCLAQQTHPSLAEDQTGTAPGVPDCPLHRAAPFALVLAYYERRGGKPTGRLRFAGHVGTGPDTRTRATLKQKLDRLARKTPPFVVKVATNEPAIWVRSELVCDVRYTEKTADCQLRHPVFIALRTDEQLEQIFRDVAEQAQAAVKKAGTSRG